MLSWLKQFNIFCLLDGNDHEGTFEWMAGVGMKREIKLSEQPFDSLQTFAGQPSWLFGHLSYELKNDIENLSSAHQPFIDFGKGYFFEPLHILRCSGGNLVIETGEGDGRELFDEIERSIPLMGNVNQHPVLAKPVLSREEYIHIINKLKEHIRRGDCYEINFCQEFQANDVVIDPYVLYAGLSSISPNPFSALYRHNDLYCACASPERFLKKEGSAIISQPMKGTSRRDAADPVTDKRNREHLRLSEKERSENVMIVDLVRNDLSRFCMEGSVQVEELFGIYPFSQVWQMISTIKGEVLPGMHWVDMVKSCFPMGSMTGAPKRRVMQLIDEYEPTARGLFSGALGYINPAGDFDFNVVIRSIFYDAAAKKLSFQAGGGITFNSDPGLEYEESMLKAKAMISVLGGN